MTAAPGRKLRTHCRRGHEFLEGNTITDKFGYRQCKKCHSDTTAEYKRRMRANKPPRGDIYERISAYELEHYIPVTESGCWLWLGTENAYGYGRVGTEVRGYAIAPRAFYAVHKGPIPEGMHVMHKCDTPLCVNPDHLAIGTHADNMRDMARKGRSRNQNTVNQPAADSEEKS